MPVEIEVKKSRFLAYLVPVKELELQLKKLRKEHKKARHFVWAYRYLENGVLREKANDDGEPSGTAGRPILNVLQKRGVLGSAVIVVRYFGGIKLGAGGLVKAYTKVTSALLDEVI